MPSRRSFLRGAAVVTAAAVVPVATASQAHADTLVSGQWIRPSSNGSLGSGGLGAPITREQVLARGRVWVDLQVPYSPNGLASPWGWWYDSRTGGRYRQDCSGFVSMAWQLPASHNTWTLRDVSTRLGGFDELLPGDALNNIDTHVMLFVGWADGSRQTAVIMEEYGRSGPTRQRNVSRSELNSRGMLAYRYHRIVEGSAPQSLQGRVFHEYRRADGSWTGFAPLDGYDGAPYFHGHGVSISGTPDGSAQAVGIGADGNLYHNARYTSGSWTGFAPLDGYGGAAHFTASNAAIAGAPDGSAHVLAVGIDGNLYHTTRLKSGSWTGFAPLDGYEGASRFAAADVAITTTPDGSAHVLAVGNDKNVYHNVRLPSGSWTGFAPLDGVGTSRMSATSVAIAGLGDGSAQVLAVGNDGYTYHNIRLTSGSWTGFAPLDGFGGAPRLAASDIAIAGLSDGSSQVLAVGNDGYVYHNLRTPAGRWQGLAPLAGFEGASRFAAQRVAIAGMPDGTAQVLATAR
ncbi:twin-arginine translocation signal domain-containing protein [Streptomyces sp. ISL-99]|uniref:twin-arginine translocation signal domain-containing protein n=1 Tax=Streptomyces sp. ISL-99 TaxID=2819193 RepID=UPI001BEC7877|nr:twin-arginine translocation signal domain-containing protein [Streptomyces sp. ISL-99]MBT2528511.1 twin-arginine translocation signal domain-containing protein [Streptomyces sp. ISL-99]